MSLKLGLCLSCFFSVFVLQAQNDAKSSEAIQAERIYLQTDGTVYTEEMRVWLSASVLTAHHQSTSLSGVLHVDLIGPNHSIRQSKKLKLKDGKTEGFFDFETDDTPGVYQIRSYTEWNKNFDEAFIAKKYIRLYGTNTAVPSSPLENIKVSKLSDGQLYLSAKLSDYIADSLDGERIRMRVESERVMNDFFVRPSPDGYLIKEMFPAGESLVRLQFQTPQTGALSIPLVIDPDYRNLSFHPEGGSLVLGLKSQVGLSITDAAGRGRKMSGVVKDHQGNEITSFKSNDQGHASFFLTPERLEGYVVEVLNAQGETISHPLPKANSEGRVLFIEQSPTQIVVNLHLTDKREDVNILVSSRGKRYFDLKGKVNEKGEYRVALKRQQLPEGIIHFALFDSEGQTTAQRLIYNESTDDLLQVNLSASKPLVKKRELSAFELQVLDQEGQPVAASATIVAINDTQMGALKLREENVRSRLLFTTDLDTEIENPGDYFYKGKAKMNAIDLFLLNTDPSDYRYGEWKEPTRFWPEKSLSVKGRIFGAWGTRRPKANIELSMLTYGNKTGVFKQTTDDEGRFVFDLNEEYGEKINVLFQTDKKGKRRDFTVKLDEQEPPTVHFNDLNNLQEADLQVQRLVTKHRERAQIRRAYNLDDDVTDLGEVVVEAYKMNSIRRRMNETFGKPDAVFDEASIKEANKKWTSGIYSILNYNFKDVIIQNTVCLGGYTAIATVPFCDMTVIMIDGEPVLPHQYPFIPYMDSDQIVSVEVIKQPTAFNKVMYDLVSSSRTMPQSPAIIAFYTRSGNGLMGAMNARKLAQDKVPVFSVQGKFPSLSHENLEPKDWVTPDYRALLHWQPHLPTGPDGKAKFSYYNADLPGTMKVIVEVVALDGRIGYAELDYEVENKKRVIKEEKAQ